MVPTGITRTKITLRRIRSAALGTSSCSTLSTRETGDTSLGGAVSLTDILGGPSTTGSNGHALLRGRLCWAPLVIIYNAI